MDVLSDPKFLVFIFIQVGSIIAVIITNRTNVMWLTKIQMEQGRRIDRAEDKISNLQSNHKST